jgi:colanic acid/amylovoran biosynthesis glycosyltransferase
VLQEQDIGVRVAYLVSRYPAASHTFIRREVAALRRRGIAVETFSIRRPAMDERQAEADRREFENTQYLLPTNLLRLLAAHGVALVCTPLRYAATLREALRHRVPGVKALASALSYFLQAILLARELRRGGHNRLHNHFANGGGTIGYLASRHLGIPWSLTLHGTSEFDYPFVLLLAEKIRAATFVACVSHFGRAQAMRLVEPEQWRKLSVVRCGIELDSLPERPPPTDGALPRVVSVGRLSPEKGYVGLIAAFAKVIERGGRAELRLIGDGPERPRIQREIRRHRLESHCALLGRLPEADVLREVARADVFVLPSFMEGLPVVLMEALGLKVPVIAPCVAGIPELVEHGKTGLLFSPANWDELTAHILVLLEDRDLRDRLAQAGRARIEAGFDATRTVDLLYSKFSEAPHSSTVGEEFPQPPEAIDGTEARRGPSRGLTHRQTQRPIA